MSSKRIPKGFNCTEEVQATILTNGVLITGTYMP